MRLQNIQDIDIGLDVELSTTMITPTRICQLLLVRWCSDLGKKVMSFELQRFMTPMKKQWQINEPIVSSLQSDRIFLFFVIAAIAAFAALNLLAGIQLIQHDM